MNMSRPRTNQTKAENIQEKLENARQAQIAQSNQATDSLTEQEKKEAFRAYWAISRKLYNKEKDVEDILWAHLKAIDCDSEELFDEGVADFGLKKK